MDASLLKERELFKKKAFAIPVVENKKKESRAQSGSQTASNGSANRKKWSKGSAQNASLGSTSSSTLTRDPLSYSRSTGSSTHNFAILAKIVNWMKQRHLDGDSEALSFDEVLDETNQLDLSSKQKNWLLTEALPNNPKVVIKEDGKYAFRPTFALKDKKSLLRLLDKNDQRGLGGVALEDVNDSLPNAERIVKNLADNNRIIVITRPIDKKKILFYNDNSQQFKVDEEFQKLWRSVAVEGIDEQKIEEYLEKQGITSMQDMGLRKVNHIQKRKKPANRKPRNFKKLNDHVSDILEDYSDKQPK